LRKFGHSKAVAHYTALRHLREAEGNQLTQNESCHRLRVASSDITRVVSLLERDGLASRVADIRESGVDRRFRNIALTEQGVQLADRSAPIMLNFARDVSKAFSTEELQSLLTLLGRVRARVEKVDKGWEEAWPESL
jgi:DNA-binding MarR family transcriptional regulator